MNPIGSKENLTRIKKNAILANIQSCWDQIHNRMYDRGWRAISDTFNKSI